jgi:hypothetical protein
MSRSKTSPKSTPAGVALSAEARRRLQRLADWLELEVTAGNQDPRVRLAYYGGMSTDTESGITYVTPLCALVQMFDPFKLAGAKRLMHNLYSVSTPLVYERVASVLGITRDEVTVLMRYMYETALSSKGIDNLEVVRALRTLK